MLNSLYATFFKPSEIRLSTPAAIIIGLLIVFVLALNAAGAVSLGVGGFVGFTLLFLFAGVIGWYWLAASINLLAQLFGGQGDGRTTMQAIAQGLWPLLLTGPAIAASKWSNILGALFSVAISIGVCVTLVLAIRRVHELDWIPAIFCLLITFSLSFLALSGLIVWPVMIFLGM
ncbi:MAG: Yip1 family protein [Scytonema sp. PMC 1069.18]|nr:Yip1 family protein [Scytonema sp. PMC 1069.18]MEC4885554.1 Yip1 family protein [Scytonema sp. PMC 1070.18]